MQSEALGGAYRVWRRKWAGDGNEEVRQNACLCQFLSFDRLAVCLYGN